MGCKYPFTPYLQGCFNPTAHSEILTWLPIFWQHSHQPNKSYVRNWWFSCSDFQKEPTYLGRIHPDMCRNHRGDTWCCYHPSGRLSQPCPSPGWKNGREWIIVFCGGGDDGSLWENSIGAMSWAIMINPLQPLGTTYKGTIWVVGFDHGFLCRVKNMARGTRQTLEKPRPKAEVFVVTKALGLC